MKIIVKANGLHKKLRGYEYNGVEIRILRNARAKYAYKLNDVWHVADSLKAAEKAIDLAV